MSGIFSKGTQAVSAPVLTGVAIQTSVSGRCIPVYYGTARGAPNLLYYADFTSSQQQAGGKGGVVGGAAGKGGAGTSLVYSATVILGIGEGPIEGFGQAWASKTPTTAAALGLTAFLGAFPQTAWSYVTTFHPGDARPYSGLAYLAAAPYDFGNSGQIPNNNFEVYGFFSRRTVYESGTIPAGRTITVGRRAWADGSTAILFVSDFGDVKNVAVPFVRVSGAPGAGQYQASATGVYTFNAVDVGKVMTIAYVGIGQDADPSLIAADVLTSATHGVGFPAARVGELTAVSEAHVIPSSVAASIPRRDAVPIPADATSPLLVRNRQLGVPVPTTGGQAHIIVRPEVPAQIVRNVLNPQAPGGAVFGGGVPAVSTVQPRALVEPTAPVPGAPLYTEIRTPTQTAEPRPRRASAAIASVTLAVNLPSTFQDNLSVADAGSGVLFTCVASSPAALQYSFVDGTYTFNAADAGKTVLISYLSLGSLQAFQDYCWAAGLFLSPTYDNQRPAAEVLDELCRFTNSEAVFSSGALKFVPRGDQALSGNGRTFTPPGSVFDLTDNQLQDRGDTDPIIVTRKRPSDRINVVQIQYRNRAAAYNPEHIEATDQAVIDALGRRTSGAQQAGAIADATTARLVAQLILQREAVRKTYEFVLDSRFCFLDPMDIVTITDAAIEQGAQKPVRILDLQEQSDKSWTVLAEDYLAGVGHAPGYAAAVGSGFVANYNADPGAINTPVFFEPPVQIATNSGLELWLAFSGAGADFGGGEIWYSSDGNNYLPLGRRDGNSRTGVSTTSLPARPDPDLVDTLGVDLTSSLGQLAAGTALDAEQGHTLCLIDSELISYLSAALTGPYQYALGTTLRRGMYGTAVAVHTAGAPFARLDELTFIYPYDKSQIGQTLYIKVRAYNRYGGGLQDLSACVAYSYTLVGPPAVGTVQDFTARQAGVAVVLSWTDLADVSVKGYDILYGPQGGTVDTATLLSTASRSTETTTQEVGPGAWVFYIRARNIADQLGPVSAASTTISALSQQFDVSGTWTKPNGITPSSMAFVELWGGGGSGGSRPGGIGGAGGGAYVSAFFLLSQLGTVETVTVGAGGASVTGTSIGLVGGHTTFGSWLTAFAGGPGGGSVVTALGGGGGGNLQDGTNNGGGPLGGLAGGSSGTAGADSTDGGGGGGNNAAGGNSTRGGGGGGSGSSSGGSSIFGGGGGGPWSGSVAGPGGASSVAGTGGAGGATSGSPGSQPGGGGGAGGTSSGPGGRGRARITIIF